MTLTIRKAVLEDVSILGHIQVRSWRSAFRNIATDNYLDNLVSEEDQIEDWKEILFRRDSIVLVAEVENSAVGYIWVTLLQDESRDWDAEIVSLHLLPEHKRKGIGRRLLETVAFKLREQGCSSVFLWVLEENQSARRFYEALGGEPAGKQQVTLGDSELTEVAYGWSDIRRLEIIK